MANYLILGSGASALGCASLLRSKGYPVSISDVAPITGHPKITLENLGCKIFVGPQDEALLAPFDPIVVSPGIPLDSHVCQVAKSLGKTLISEVDLALSYYEGLRIGITGTNGKSTVVTLFEHIALKFGLDCLACGNLGKTPSELIAEGLSPAILALELSSYQLELTKHINCKASIFTSFSSDHLARHKSLKNYIRAKWNLADQTVEQGIIVLSESFLKGLVDFDLPLPKNRKVVAVVSSHIDNKTEGIETSFFEADRKILYYKKKQIHLNQDFSYHDNLNLAYCLIAFDHSVGNINFEEIVNYSRDYKKLPHRFELIRDIKGVPIINDSKSTNLESTIAALKSMKTACYLLLGGQGKEGDAYSTIANQKKKIQKVYSFGSSSKEIYSDLKSLVDAKQFDTLEGALKQLSKDFKQSPHPILFSPACASFDEFLNFEERGLYFREIILKYLE